MLPDRSDTFWKHLIDGTIDHKFKSVPAGLCIARNKRSVKNDASPGNMKKCIDEVYAFFQKYESILQDDIKAIVP